MPRDAIAGFLPVGNRRGLLLLVLWLGGLLLFCLWMNTRYNDFPLFFHPDEPSKASQIVTQQWNFRHPQLLLNSTRVMAAVVGAGENWQKIAEAGRWVSAGFAAGAVVLFVLMARWEHGYVTAIVAGALMTLSRSLVTYSHYMKEDTALLLGISACFVALVWLWRCGGLWQALVVGMACGLAASGKYIGIVMLPIALVLLCRQPDLIRTGRRIQAAAIMFAGMAVVFCAFNFPMFMHPDWLWRGLGGETQHVLSDHHGLQVDYWRWNVLSLLYGEIFWPVLLLGCATAIWTAATWRQRPMSLRLVVIFALGYLAMLAVSRIEAARYLLPVVLLLHYLAAVGVVCFSQWLTPRTPVAQGAVLTCLCAMLLVPKAFTVVDYLGQFRDDSRLQLRAWAASHLEQTAQVIQESCVAMPLTLPGVEAKVVTEQFAVSRGGPRELRQAGFDYVVVSHTAYRRFFDASRPTSQSQAWYESCRRRYMELFQQGELVWSADPQGQAVGPFTNPSLRVYRLAATEAAEVESSASMARTK
jgi:hypothetical protein